MQPDPRQLIRTRQIAGAYPAATWLACLGPLAGRGRGTAWLGTVLRGVAIQAGVIGVIGFLSGRDGIVLGLVAAAVAVAAWLAARGFRRRVLPAAIHDAIVPFLIVLREEMDRDEPVALRLDLTGAEHGRKRLGEWRDGSGVPRVVERRYADPWLAGEARLADDARLRWEVTDELRRRDVTRRSRSGKAKTKTKYKLTRHLTVRLGLPRAAYDARRAAAGGGSGLRLAVKPGEKRDVVVVRRAIVTRRREEPLQAEHLLALIGEAYGRAASAGEGGR